MISRPTILCDIRSWDYTTFPPGHFDMVWASPVCTEYSRALTTRPRRLLEGDALVLSASNFDTMSRETTSQPAASKALPTDLVPQKSSRSLGIFKEQDHRHCDDQDNSRVHRTGLFSYG